MLKKFKYIIVVLTGIFSAVAAFLIMGIPSAVISNPWYMRMTQVNNVDYFFLASISLLFGIFIALICHRKINRISVNYSIGLSGILGGSLAVSCPLCIAVFVTVFGSSFMMTYFDPLRPVFGIISIGLLCYGIYTVMYCKPCMAVKDDKR